VPALKHETDQKSDGKRTKRRVAGESSQLIEHPAGPTTCFYGPSNALAGRLNEFRNIANSFRGLIQYERRIVFASGHVRLHGQRPSIVSVMGLFPQRLSALFWDKAALQLDVIGRIDAAFRPCARPRSRSGMHSILTFALLS
jgi:hypothetical protein